MFKKMKHYGFWISLSGALILLLNSFGRAFGFSIDNKIVEDCVMAIAGLLVVFGVVVPDKKECDNISTKEDNKTNEKNNVEENKNK